MKASNPFNLLILILVLINAIALAQPGSYYPAPSSVNYQNDTLSIHPPDSLPADPVILMGYNIYVDDDFYYNVMVTDLEEPVHFYLDDESLLPGSRIFCVDAVYNEWISESACDTATILYGYELRFLEDWSSASFETLQWTTDSDHWVINSGEGNPAPSVSFQGEPGLTNYEVSLESFPLNAMGLTNGTVWLDFDLKLISNNSTGEEILRVQVWNSSNQNWTTVAHYFNEDGSFGWEWQHINIKSQSMNRVIKIRFVATGADSEEIVAWQVDNIHIYRKCDGAYELELVEHDDFNQLIWYGPEGCGIDEWIHWDDGENSGNSIGLGQACEFMVAARWDISQMSYYNNSVIDKVKFFPAEPAATYQVRIWSGEGPDSLLVDQPVNSPVIGEWNTVEIEPPIPVDISKELWVGYYINAQAGWPAGVDDGPAINGYGNMMFWEGTWQTMLEINEALNFNWNIACHIVDTSYEDKWKCNIYRNKNDEGYEYLETATEWQEYVDSNVFIADHYCYEVTWVWMEYGDTCESDPGQEACEEIWYGTEPIEIENTVNIYPNPASSVLNITSPEKINKVRIYNMLGECELKLEIGNSEGKVDVGRLQSGIYFVEVVTASGTYKSKVLIFR